METIKLSANDEHLQIELELVESLDESQVHHQAHLEYKQEMIKRAMTMKVTGGGGLETNGEQQTSPRPMPS